MSLLQTALNSHKVAGTLPGETVFIAVEDFLSSAELSKTVSDGKFLSLESGELVDRYDGRTTLAMEELSTAIIAAIVAAGVAIAALMYKLYKHFFGGDKDGAALHDKVDNINDVIESSTVDVVGAVEQITDARLSVQEAENKKKMLEQLDAVAKKHEQTMTNNIKFAIIADSRNGNRYITYHKYLSEALDKLSGELLSLEAQVDKGADLIKTISSLPANGDNTHLNSLLVKETQMLNDKLDLYRTVYRSHHIDKTLDAFNKHRADLEKQGAPSDFLASMQKNDAKSFINGLMKQCAVNTDEMSKRLEQSKDDINAVIKVTKKYDGFDKEHAKLSVSSKEISDYLTALRLGMNTCRQHAKIVLTVLKSEDLLYRSIVDCLTLIMHYTNDVANVVDSYSDTSNKSLIKQSKEKLSSFFSKLKGKN